MTDREKTLRLQSALEARRAIESLKDAKGLPTARERLTLALAWIDEIEGKQKQ